jgi:beta-lactamase class A
MTKAACATLFLLGLSACVHCKPFPAAAPCHDPALQSGLERVVRDLSLRKAAAEQRLGIMLVDITQPDDPRAAGINPGRMMYAASLPKIAILYAALKRADEGTLVWNARLQTLAEEMIQVSSNRAATELFHLAGPSYIAELLQSEPFALYDRKSEGGLWVGKEYGPGPAWQRDPLGQLSHAATPAAVARFYYLLDTGWLLSPERTALMKEILSVSHLEHSFTRGLARYGPRVRLYRKAGTWRTYHSDSALVEHGGRRYIAVALAEDPDAAEWLEGLIVELDGLILSWR